MSNRHQILKRERFYLRTTGRGWWICLWCRFKNVRLQEGLDECERCHSYTHVRYGNSFKMIVVQAKEPLQTPA